MGWERKDLKGLTVQAVSKAESGLSRKRMEGSTMAPDKGRHKSKGWMGR